MKRLVIEEEKIIRQTLAQCGGSRVKAMELLGKPLGMFERDGEEAQEGVTIVDDV